ncbi:DUF2855 family protein [Trujillonella endophytica]|uniref:DUF2855 domain-containing protein n=1 Tax=Trujillonella endophytica TaxID=673521 RepID=A0A1H8SGM3_9ACTN|nr:DUF2855 family protein [Trujillella endophytica]SEO77458.1 Protein of unknown function [Trujillella endophytica]
MADFLVHRDDPRTFRFDDGEAAASDVAEGAVQFTVERFGLTANNLTYAVLGDALHYWDFFPAPEGWGRIPAWGFGRAEASGVEGIAVGDRFYGYWPMSTRVTLQVTAGGPGFVDSSPARAALPAVYNRYLRAVPATGFPAALDDAAAVVRPLFLTGWLIADQLAGSAWHGAGTVVLASASSKTALCTAAAIRERDDPPSVIGLTSAGHVASTAALGLYDEVLPYDEVAALPRDRGVVLVDMAGDPGIRAAVHETTREALRASIMVGATHWERASLEGADLPGPQPEMFFAPTVAQERAADLGELPFARRLGAAWAEFATARLPQLVRFEHATGADALAGAYTALLEGAVDPRRGLVLSL